MKVLIIDDHRLFAEAIRSTLQEHGMEVVHVAETAAEGIEAVHRERPDLVMVDLGLPDGDGLEVGERLMAELPGTKVLAVTAMNDPKAVQKAVGLGFHGYLTKDTSMPRFVDSVKAAAAGQVVVPHRLVAGPDATASEEERQAAMLAEQLTPREMRVLVLLVEGASSPTISERLSISPNTVRTHIQNILTKLQVHSRLEAATFAVRFGLVNVPGRQTA